MACNFLNVEKLTMENGNNIRVGGSIGGGRGQYLEDQKQFFDNPHWSMSYKDIA